MGGKTSTSTSQVSIPPEVLARYNSVNATAQQVAQTPFQEYSTNPNAFVAPITPTQQAGIQNTNAAAGMAQPYFQAGTGFALAGAQPINAQPLNTSEFMNPYLQTVLGSTAAQINQNNQQAMAGQTGNAINQGYFGGDRSGIASAVLQGQQNLAAGQVYSGIASDAYNQALAAAQQQQGVNLGAAQANRQALQQTGDTLAQLGTGAQGAAIQGAQAQLGAGQVEQQTTQAGLTALYNQFLQQQSYPFQTAQFLANIAEGTGALSGNTTTSTQPGGLFSDERLKEDMRPIGKGFDGANIYRFRYRHDPANLVRIGFSAQEMERKHPEAVGEEGGYKTVDYGKATDDSAHMGGFAKAANDEWEEPRRARQMGGMSGWGMYPPGVNPMSIGELLQAQAQMYGPGFGGAGLYGGSASAMPHGGSSYVPAPMGGAPMMIHGTPPPTRPQATALDALHSAAGLSGDVEGLENDAKDVQGGYNWLRERVGPGSVGGSGDPFDANVQIQRQATQREDYPNPWKLGADLPANMQSGSGSAAGGLRVGRDGGGLTPPPPGQGGGDPFSGLGFMGAIPEAMLGYGKDFAGALGLKLANGGFARAHRQYGGLDPSDPQNDSPYAPKGPGLNIPTQPEQHQQLQGTKPSPQSGSSSPMGGISSLLGAGSDIANIAKAAPEMGALASGIGSGIAGAAGAIGSGFSSLLPFLALLNRGGRVGRANGGELDIPDDKSEVVPLEPSKPSSQGGGYSTMSDIMDIAKIAAMFAARGGRVGRAEGGGLDSMRADLEAGDDDPLGDMLLRKVLAPPDLGSDPGPAVPAAAPGSPAGGPGAAAAPSAGFAGAKPPAAPTAASGAAPAGFAGILKAEGTGLNKASGAFGAGQFLPSTFLGEAKKVFPERVRGMSDADIMALQHTPEGAQMQAQMIPHLRGENAAVLQAHGLPVNPVTEHGMWILGPREGPRVLSADPSTPMENLVRPIAINENRRIMAGKTAGQFVDWLGRSIGHARGGFAGARQGFDDGGFVGDGAGVAVDPNDPTKVIPVDPATTAVVQANREAAKAGDPTAPPAAKEAVASDVGARAAAGMADAAPSGFLPANQNSAGAPSASQQQQGIDLDQDARDNRMGRQFYAQEVARQRGPQGGGILGVLQRNWIPIMQGIAAGASAPTSHPLTSLLVGGGAFAGAEQAQRNYQLGQARTLAELEQSGENTDVGAFVGQSGRINAIGGLYSQAMNAFDQGYTPMNRTIAGPNGVEQMYLGPHGEQIPKSEYLRRRNEQIFSLVGSLGGSGNMSAPIRSMQSIVAPGTAGGPPPGSPTNAAPPNPNVVSSSVPNGAVGAGAAGAGTLGASAGAGASGVRPPPVAGESGGQGQAGPPVTPPAAPPAAPSNLPGRSAEERAARGDYMNSGNAVPTVDATGIDPESNPYLLTARSQQEMGFPGMQDQAQADATKADAIFHGQQAAFLADGKTPDYRFAQVGPAQDKITADSQMNLQRGSQVAAAAADWHNTAGQMQQAIHNLRDIYKDESPNIGADQKAKLIGIWRTMFGDRATSEQAKAFQTAVEQGNKVAALQMINTVQQGLTGAPKAGLDTARMATPSPNMSPDTRYALVHQQQAMLDRETAYMNAIAKYHGRIQDWTRFDTEWSNENPVEKYERQATFELGGYFAGMSDAGKARFAYYPHTDKEYDSVPKDAPVVYKGHKGYK